jgi:hypothetical protein
VDSSKGGFRRRRVAVAWLALYALFLAATPFEHHDLLCELKTPLHCTACTSALVGSDPVRTALVGDWTLNDLGCAVIVEWTVAGAFLSTPSAGRSPPAFT